MSDSPNKKNNLNLLQALDALLTERNVTQAARRLFVTQSAMSNSLLQLRKFFKDDLLVRGIGGMVLTPKAELIQPKLHQSVKKLQSIYEMDLKFDPENSSRVFNIGISEFIEFSVLPKLIDKVRSSAPNVRLEVNTINQVTSQEPFKDMNSFRHGRMEIALGCLSDTPSVPQVTREDCLKLERCVVGRKDNPLLQKKITAAKYLNANHIHLTYQPMMRSGMIDQALKKQGKKRHVVTSVNSVFAALHTAQETDLLASLPNKLPETILKNFNLVSQPIPITLPERFLYTLFPSQNKSDLGLCWLRDIFDETLAEFKKQQK